MITVIGAGLGGLTLARVLNLRSVPVEVFEGETSPNSRRQGGMLDIHDESGQPALAAAGLLSQLPAITLAEGDATRVLDKHGTVLFSDDGDGARPEVERGALRQLLLSSLPPSLVRWNARVVSVRTDAAGHPEVTFADGSSIRPEVLVGADGAWSKIRPLVSDLSPVYTGLSFIEMSFHHAPERFPTQARVVGDGLMFALSDRKGFIAHREPAGELCVYVALPVAEDWALSTRPTRDDLLEYFVDWSDDLRSLIRDSEGDLTPRTIHAMPIGHRWDRVPGVTLVGDAAHLMSPFAGEGANLAMLDGAELAQAIAARPYDIETALATYESAMFERSARAASESAANLDICFNDSAPRDLVALFANLSAMPHDGDA